MSVYLFYVGIMPVAWNNKKQSYTTRSSCEAEYIGELIAVINAVWLSKLFSKLKIKRIERRYLIPVYANNDGIIDITEHEQYQKKIKHIALHYHYIKDLIKKG